jgi:uncharacterized membrane protein
MKGILLLDRAIEVVLTTGLAVSGLLLLTGLADGSDMALRAGTILLMSTPVARVVVVTIGMFAKRDWVFGLVSLWVLAVLATSISVAFHH